MKMKMRMRMKMKTGKGKKKKRHSTKTTYSIPSIISDISALQSSFNNLPVRIVGKFAVAIAEIEV